MLQDILISGAFMAFELFVLAKWLESREKKTNAIAWAPFRKMLLDAVVTCYDDLIVASKSFETEIEACFTRIRNDGALKKDEYQNILQIIDVHQQIIDKVRDDFYYVVQTVAPSMQPYAAQYCTEILWFVNGVKRSLEKAKRRILELDPSDIGDNEKSSQPLNGVDAMKISIKLYREYRFAQFKENFVNSAWNKEGLHYHPGSGEFLFPDDFASAIDTEKAAAELRNTPRTSPVKSFFAPE